jgi:hypothetical protein
MQTVFRNSREIDLVLGNFLVVSRMLFEQRTIFNQLFERNITSSFDFSCLQKGTLNYFYSQIPSLQLYSLNVPSITWFSIDKFNNSILYSNANHGISYLDLNEDFIEDMALHMKNNSISHCHDKRISGLEIHRDGGNRFLIKFNSLQVFIHVTNHY